VKTLFLLCLLMCYGVTSRTLAQVTREELTTQFNAPLTALDPAKPDEYLRLAEDVFDFDQSPTGVTLSTQLLVRAYWIDLHDGGDTQIAASSCLALAALPGSTHVESSLKALAQRLSPHAASVIKKSSSKQPRFESAGYQIASILGMIRAGDGGWANQLISRPEVAAALEAVDSLLRRLGVSGGAEEIRREAKRWPCPTCSNERIVRRSSGAEASWRICSNCGGLPGLRLSDAQLISHLRAESLLLEGAQRSWAAQIVADQGVPLIDPDPTTLPLIFGIDPSRLLFREGTWQTVND